MKFYSISFKLDFKYQIFIIQALVIISNLPPLQISWSKERPRRGMSTWQKRKNIWKNHPENFNEKKCKERQGGKMKLREKASTKLT